MAAKKKKKGDGISGIVSRRAGARAFRKGVKKLRKRRGTGRLLDAGEGQFSGIGATRRRANKREFERLLQQR